MMIHTLKIMTMIRVKKKIKKIAAYFLILY